MEGKFLEKELSRRLMKCFYQTRNMYGSGHREKFYDKVIDEVFEAEGLYVINKPRIAMYSAMTGKIVSYIIPDKLIERKIIVELKAKPFTSYQDISQVKEYLEITHAQILYLVNFGEKDFKPRRYIHTKDRKKFLHPPKK